MKLEKNNYFKVYGFLILSIYGTAHEFKEKPEGKGLF
jgi:hypothetical protein